MSAQVDEVPAFAGSEKVLLGRRGEALEDRIDPGRRCEVEANLGAVRPWVTVTLARRPGSLVATVYFVPPETFLVERTFVTVCGTPPAR